MTRKYVIYDRTFKRLATTEVFDERVDAVNKMVETTDGGTVLTVEVDDDEDEKEDE